MLFRRSVVGVRALAIATPASTRAPGHSMGGKLRDPVTVTGTVDFVATDNACDIPGHYEDGMHGAISFGGGQ